MSYSPDRFALQAAPSSQWWIQAHLRPYSPLGRCTQHAGVAPCSLLRRAGGGNKLICACAGRQRPQCGSPVDAERSRHAVQTTFSSIKEAATGDPPDVPTPQVVCRPHHSLQKTPSPPFPPPDDKPMTFCSAWQATSRSMPPSLQCVRSHARFSRTGFAD